MKKFLTLCVALASLSTSTVMAADNTTANTVVAPTPVPAAAIPVPATPAAPVATTPTPHHHHNDGGTTGNGQNADGSKKHHHPTPPPASDPNCTDPILDAHGAFLGCVPDNYTNDSIGFVGGNVLLPSSSAYQVNGQWTFCNGSVILEGGQPRCMMDAPAPADAAPVADAPVIPLSPENSLSSDSNSSLRSDKDLF